MISKEKIAKIKLVMLVLSGRIERSFMNDLISLMINIIIIIVITILYINDLSMI